MGEKKSVNRRTKKKKKSIGNLNRRKAKRDPEIQYEFMKAYLYQQLAPLSF